MAISKEKRIPTRLSRPCLNCCLVDTKREHIYPHKWRINTIRYLSIAVQLKNPPLESYFYTTEGYSHRNWGPFLERPGNFSGPKAKFKIQTTSIVAQFLADHKPVNFASSTDSFIVFFGKLLKLCS